MHKQINVLACSNKKLCSCQCFDKHFFNSVTIIYPNMFLFPIEKTIIFSLVLVVQYYSVHTSVVITLVAQDRGHGFMQRLLTVNLSLSSGLSHA